MTLVVILVMFGSLGWLARASQRKEIERDPLFSKDPQVRARILAEYEVQAAAARRLPSSSRSVAPTPSSAGPKRKVTKVEFMMGKRD